MIGVNGYLGVTSGSMGTVAIEGAGSTWTSSGTVFSVGRIGTGNLTVSDGGSLVTAIGYIGYYAGSAGTVTVDARRADHPDYVIHENVAWDHIALDEDLKRLAGRAAAICFGTLAQRLPTSRATIQQALAEVSPRCLIVYDVNLRQHWYDRTRIEASLAKAHCVKLNSDEVLVLAELLQIGTPDHVSLAKAIRQRFDVDVVCITRGAEGCLMVGPDAVVDRPGVAVEVADAVGAGDAFTAAWIHARLLAWPLEAQAAFANEVGALVASRPGAMPPLRDELAAVAKRFP